MKVEYMILKGIKTPLGGVCLAHQAVDLLLGYAESKGLGLDASL